MFSFKTTKTIEHTLTKKEFVEILRKIGMVEEEWSEFTLTIRTEGENIRLEFKNIKTYK